ncbi:MAG: hypothetical protein QOG37_2329, partial [Mycobacterium sp.]|nr:hypothetical protein [Mycobacterium sp.]
MGRHSRPDSEDSAPEPFDAYDADHQEPGSEGDDYNDYPDINQPAEPPSAGQFGTDVGHDADRGQYPAEGEYAAPGADDYPDFGWRPADAQVPSEAPSAEPPAAPPPAQFRASHRETSEWQGGHRSKGGRRGVSIGVIAALVTVVVVVAGVIVWQFFGDALSHRSHTAAARCVGGKDSVAVLADPSIVEQVKELADSYNTTSAPIGDRCVAVTVKSAGSDAVISGFVGKWPAELGSQPGLWIPGSSISAARLSGAAGQKTISDSRSLVTSPVLLAMRPEFGPVLSKQNWAALPGLQANPNTMAGLNSPTWGSLRLALPVTGNADASLLAGEAIAAASAPAGAPPTAGVGAVRTLVGGQPKLADDSVTEAMNALLKPGDAASAPVHAVVTTEQQLFQRGQSTSDAKSKLGSWTPPGPVAVADYPTVLLSGSWLSQEQTTAASAFSRYLHKPEQLAQLAKAGFRVSDVKPPSSPVTSFAALPATLSVGDDAMRATLADILATPSTGVAATIMLDQSLPNDDGGGKTRLANVIAALGGQIKA